MARLEELTRGATVKGILADGLVTLTSHKGLPAGDQTSDSGTVEERSGRCGMGGRGRRGFYRALVHPEPERRPGPATDLEPDEGWQTHHGRRQDREAGSH